MTIHPPSLLQMSFYPLQIRKVGSTALYCCTSQKLREGLELKKGHYESLSLPFFHAGKDQ